ncbi:hypothetical protein PG993_006291 [Apiospora rasikravindrae]|uniref:Uncharacterized protein n=1 Tax=Apiospora rasikravindrae TaxID=990691 RepID=A0ABR1T594_9PEZI
MAIVIRSNAPAACSYTSRPAPLMWPRFCPQVAVCTSQRLESWTAAIFRLPGNLQAESVAYELATKSHGSIDCFFGGRSTAAHITFAKPRSSQYTGVRHELDQSARVVSKSDVEQALTVALIVAGRSPSCQPKKPSSLPRTPTKRM